MFNSSYFTINNHNSISYFKRNMIIFKELIC
nr:MAG TPA: hypothetical protein [Crassvirales sp.]